MFEMLRRVTGKAFHVQGPAEEKPRSTSLIRTRGWRNRCYLCGLSSSSSILISGSEAHKTRQTDKQTEQ